jgi:multiple sugar transport system permease protein
MSIWWGAGYQMLLFLAGLQSISRTYYEAADIDGASAFTKLFRITIPLLSPTIFFAGITAIISSFQVFDQAFVMTDGGPDYASHTLVLHIYRKAFQFMEVGAANSVASILFIMILIITIVQMVFQKKWVFYEGD